MAKKAKKKDTKQAKQDDGVLYFILKYRKMNDANRGTEWEREYAEAHARWEAHRKQMSDAKVADQAAADESGDASSYSSESEASDSQGSEGTLAADSNLQALRDKLTSD